MKSKMTGMIPVKPKQKSRFSVKLMEEIEVDIKCDDCPTHVENTVRGIDGVYDATWKNENGMLLVVFDSAKTTIEKIELAIAGAGHSTPHHKAKIEFYTDAPRCCKYTGSGNR